MFASVTQLIRQAFVYSKVLAPEENLTQDGSEAVNLLIGLRLLNELILTNNMKGNNWVLETNEEFNVVAGSDSLVLDDWSYIYKVRFLLGDVWFNIVEENLNNFLNKALLPTSTGVPFVMYPQRTATGYLLRFFQQSNQDYTFEVWGYKQVALFTEPSQALTGFNAFYETYYLYELAYRVQNYYQIPHTPFILEQRQVLRQQLRDLKQTRLDREFSQVSQTGGQQFSSVAALNLSQGYSP